MTALMRRCRRRRRAVGLLSPLSPARRRGRRRGRPRPERGIAPRSRTSAKAICSWRSPPVKTAVMGRPWPSARRWILVENPPWDRPSASSGVSPPDGAGPASAGGVLVSANDRGIDKVQIPVDLAPCVSLSLKGGENAVPNTRPTPSVEAARHRSDRAIALWQIAPGGAGAVDPQHAAHHSAVIMIGSARAGPLRRQQRLKPPPLFVRHISTSHLAHMGRTTPSRYPLQTRPSHATGLRVGEGAYLGR